MKEIKLNNIKSVVKEINSAVSDDVTVVLEKGEYHIYPEDVSHRTFKITNSMPEHKVKTYGASYEKNLGVVIDGKKNVVIDGNGSKLVTHCKIIPFCVFESENITIKNFTFDYATPTVAELEVIDMGEGYYTFKVHPDVKYRIDDEGKITWYGENFEFYPVNHYCQRYIPGKEIVISQEPGPMKDETARYEELDENILKITFVSEKANPYLLGLGQHLHLRDGMRDHCGTFFDRSRNIRFENMNMYFMHGLGIVGQRCENITMNKVICAPDPTSGRIISCFADSSQFSSCRGDIIATNCIFDGTNDDAINVHGTYMKIVESEGNTIVARFVQPDTYNYNIFEVGDIVEVSDPDYMLPEDTATVVSAELINPYDIKIVFDKSAEKFKVDYVIENISACPNVHISGCTIKRLPTKGFLTSTRGKVVVENNSFYCMGREVVLLANDAKSWWETGPVTDVTIRNNRIYNQFAKPIVRIHPENTKFREGQYVHGKIIIEGNIAVGSEQVPWMHAKSTESIILRNNRATFEPLPDEIENCGNIVTE